MITNIGKFEVRLQSLKADFKAMLAYKRIHLQLIIKREHTIGQTKTKNRSPHAISSSDIYDVYQ